MISAAVASLSLFAMGCSNSTSAPDLASVDATTSFDYDFVIPDGTEDRINAGETVEVVPAELVVTVGESIRIINEDTVDHVVGIFFVPAQSELRKTFTSPGELIGECDVHPSGSFSLTVEP